MHKWSSECQSAPRYATTRAKVSASAFYLMHGIDAHHVIMSNVGDCSIFMLLYFEFTCYNGNYVFAACQLANHTHYEI